MRAHQGVELSKPGPGRQQGSQLCLLQKHQLSLVQLFINMLPETLRSGPGKATQHIQEHLQITYLSGAFIHGLNKSRQLSTLYQHRIIRPVCRQIKRKRTQLFNRHPKAMDVFGLIGLHRKLIVLQKFVVQTGTQLQYLISSHHLFN